MRRPGSAASARSPTARRGRRRGSPSPPVVTQLIASAPSAGDSAGVMPLRSVPDRRGGRRRWSASRLADDHAGPAPKRRWSWARRRRRRSERRRRAFELVERSSRGSPDRVGVVGRCAHDARMQPALGQRQVSATLEPAVNLSAVTASSKPSRRDARRRRRPPPRRTARPASKARVVASVPDWNPCSPARITPTDRREVHEPPHRSRESSPRPRREDGDRQHVRGDDTPRDRPGGVLRRCRARAPGATPMPRACRGRRRRCGRRRMRGVRPPSQLCRSSHQAGRRRSPVLRAREEQTQDERGDGEDRRDDPGGPAEVPPGVIHRASSRRSQVRGARPRDRRPITRKAGPGAVSTRDGAAVGRRRSRATIGRPSPAAARSGVTATSRSGRSARTPASASLGAHPRAVVG